MVVMRHHLIMHHHVIVHVIVMRHVIHHVLVMTMHHHGVTVVMLLTLRIIDVVLGVMFEEREGRAGRRMVTLMPEEMAKDDCESQNCQGQEKEPNASPSALFATVLQFLLRTNHNDRNQLRSDRLCRHFLHIGGFLLDGDRHITW
jgi:hypothetical protein